MKSDTEIYRNELEIKEFIRDGDGEISPKEIKEIEKGEK